MATGIPLYFPGHYGIPLSTIVRALRTGEQGWANAGLAALLDYLMRLLPLAAGRVPPRELLWLPRELEQAQQRRDFVRLADLIEYELPHSPLPALFPVTRAQLRVAPAAHQMAGEAVEIGIDAAAGTLPLEFAFTQLDRSRPPGEVPQTFRPYSRDPKWRWTGPARPGWYRLGVYIRPLGSTLDFVGGERTDYRISASR